MTDAPHSDRMAPQGPGLPDPDRYPTLYADIPMKRLMAWVIDSLIILGVTLVLIPFTAFTALFYLPFLWLVVGLVYRIWSLASRSATPGMRMMSIELRNGHGAPLTLGEGTAHTVLYTLCMTMFLPILISAGLMLGSARAQGLPDMVLGTAALNRSR